MLRQPKYQSILVFALCLLSVVLAFKLITLDWLEWRISAVAHTPASYRIKTTSPMLIVSQYLTDDFFPRENINVFSPKGECLGGSEVQWKISAGDRLKETRALKSFYWAIFMSPVILIWAFVNMLWRWWEKRNHVVFIPLGLCLIWICAMRLSGSHVSVDPYWPSYDFDCVYSLVIKAELISVNQPALALFALVVLSELIAVVLLVRSLFAKVSKESPEVGL